LLRKRWKLLKTAEAMLILVNLQFDGFLNRICVRLEQNLGLAWPQLPEGAAKTRSGFPDDFKDKCLKNGPMR
jgi:hypothetical protein